MKKVLIMGGNEFVGKATAKKFLKENYIVYVLNRGNRKNLKDVIHLKCDRNNIQNMKEILKDIYIDTIVDISAYTQSQVEILQIIMKEHFKHYILMSSASVYSNISIYPVKENDPVGKNIIWGDYAKNKFLAEKETIKNAKVNNFKYTIFRPFYIYGIGNNLDRENYIFSRIKYSLPVFLPNKGENIIQFGYIEDLTEAILNASQDEKYHNDIFNISGDEYITFNQLVKTCAEVMNKEVKIKYINTFENNVKARDWFPFRDIALFGNISKIKEKGFSNKYTLVKGLRETYQYCEENNLLMKPNLNKLEK